MKSKYSCVNEPDRQTRNRKILVGLVPPWEHIPPVWELRIGEYRVFYDVDENIVTILAIGSKRGDRLYIEGEEIQL